MRKRDPHKVVTGGNLVAGDVRRRKSTPALPHGRGSVVMGPKLASCLPRRDHRVNHGVHLWI